MRTAIITFSPQGVVLGTRLKKAMSGSELFIHALLPNRRGARRFERVSELVGELFARVEGLVVIGPTGVAVRAISPHVRSKLSDPAVVVVDAGGRFAVSLLSGHEGGANALAVQVANELGAEPVISTTTEAVKTVTVGVGCRRGTSAGLIVEAIQEGLRRAAVSIGAVRWLATAELKRNEAGLMEAARSLGLPLRILPNWQLLRAGDSVTPSEFVRKITQLPAVAEPAALASGRETRLLLKRQVIHGVTIAVAVENCLWSE